MKKLIITLTLMLAIFQTQAQIQKQDTLIGPHGGRIKVTQGYSIETLGCDNYMEVYLYNEVSDPIFNKGISGEVKFFYEKKNTITPLIAYGIDGFTCKILSPDFSNYQVTMNLLDRLIVSANFNECIVPKQ